MHKNRKDIKAINKKKQKIMALFSTEIIFVMDSTWSNSTILFRAVKKVEIHKSKK